MSFLRFPKNRVVAYRNSFALYHESRGKTFIYCWDIIQCILWYLLAIKIEHDTTVQLEFGDNLLQFSRNTELTETEKY